MQNIESPLTGAAAEPVKTVQAVPDNNNASLGSNYNVVRRNGKLTSFDKNKIAIAMTKAFLAVEGGQAAASTRVHETVEKLTNLVVATLTRRQPDGGTFHIEDIQDQVELALMRNGEQKDRPRLRAVSRRARLGSRAEQTRSRPRKPTKRNVSKLRSSSRTAALSRSIPHACKPSSAKPASGLASVDAEKVYDETLKNLFDGVPFKDVSPDRGHECARPDRP